MKCPRCVQAVLPGESSCGSCGYSLEVPDEQFGQGAVSVERLTDADGNLSASEREAIGQILAEFERRFPQLFLMVYLGALPAPASPRQFGFWLLNHAAIPLLDALRPNERGLVLVVDPVAGSATLTAGYFLECYLKQEELDDLLGGGRKDLAKGAYVAAVRGLAGRLSEKLERRAREAAREPSAFAPPAPAPGGAFPALVRLGEPVGLREKEPLAAPAPAPVAAAPGMAENQAAVPGFPETDRAEEPESLAASAGQTIEYKQTGGSS